MRNAITALTLATLAAGCGGTEDIYAFYMEPMADPTISQTITHNFNGATPVADPTTASDWTRDDDLCPRTHREHFQRRGAKS